MIPLLLTACSCVSDSKGEATAIETELLRDYRFGQQQLIEIWGQACALAITKVCTTSLLQTFVSRLYFLLASYPHWAVTVKQNTARGLFFSLSQVIHNLPSIHICVVRSSSVPSLYIKVEVHNIILESLYSSFVLLLNEALSECAVTLPNLFSLGH